NYTVYLKQTNKQEVAVEALTEIYDLTDIHVENGVLMINVERKPSNASKSIWGRIDDIKLSPTMKVMVSMKNIRELQVNGGGKIISQNSLATSNVTLSVSGNGTMDLDLKGDVIKAEVSGAGKINMKGYGNSLEALVSGSGGINGFACGMETAKARVSGTGYCELNVTNELVAAIQGNGTIKHKGNTKNVQKKVYGSGSVDRAY
ncbi:MAG TPA: head GIN domain-containing protein, partial [Cyclobacteriaceae bacterium]|nr:head GIN domain-containing protein [Cyclobacteriaceae bacterium]